MTTLANVQPGSVEEHLLKDHRERRAEDAKLQGDALAVVQLLGRVYADRADPLLVALDWLDSVEMPACFPGEHRASVDYALGEAVLRFYEEETNTTLAVRFRRDDPLDYVKFAVTASVHEWLQAVLLKPAIPEALR